MKAFRITQQRYSRTLSGKGSAKYGARWNSKGIEIIYCAEHRSLALNEVLVHISLDNLSRTYVMVEIDIPDDVSISAISKEELPPDWNRFPPPESNKQIGDQFIQEGKACILKIPSVIVEEEFNLLINPKHADFTSISIEKVAPFRIDQRFFN